MNTGFVRNIFIFALIIFAIVSIKFAREAFLVSGDPAQSNVSVTIAQGSSVRRIASELENKGIIQSPFLFELYVRVRGLSGSIPAGLFFLKEDSSFADVTATLLDAQAAGIQVTIPEGYTLRKIWDTLHAAFPNIKEADFWKMAGRASPLKKIEPILAHLSSTQDLEGYVFPDTYFFAPEASAESIVRTMVETLPRRLRELGIQKTGKDLHAFLTLASIVEREVRDPKDMANAADIFFRRLEIGMALQADSTVNYVIDGKNPSLTAAEMKTNSPYNTYLYAGLPPGPICNPGVNALRAAAHPTKNSWLYFLTTPSGDVKYARTFDDHVANKSRYLR